MGGGGAHKAPPSKVRLSKRISCKYLLIITYQTDNDEEHLNDVSVGYGDEAAQQRVEQGDHGAQDDGHLLLQTQDHLDIKD